MDLSEFELPPAVEKTARAHNQGTIACENVADASEKRQPFSYADAARQVRPPQFEFQNLPQPEKMGEYPAIQIPQAAYERGLQYCKFCLIGRIDLIKVPIDKVRQMAKEKWNPSGDWLITPIGKGYLFIRFSNADDLNRIWAKGSWIFGDSPLRLSAWSPDFNPDVQRQSHALIWVRFPGLSQEYWDPEALMSIARGVGHPMQIDQKTLNRDFGYFAKVLVDVDLSCNIPDQIYVNTKTTEFWQTVEVGQLPNMCNHCKCVGHLVTDCKKLKGVLKQQDKMKVVAKNITPISPQAEVGTMGKKRRRKKTANANEKGKETWVSKVSQVKDVSNKFGVLADLAVVYADESNISTTKSSSPMVEKAAESTEVEVVEVINVAGNLAVENEHVAQVSAGKSLCQDGTENFVDGALGLNAPVETLVPIKERSNEATANLAENLVTTDKDLSNYVDKGGYETNQIRSDVENQGSPTLNRAPNLASPPDIDKGPAVETPNSRVDSYSSSSTRYADQGSPTSGDGNRLKLVNEANSLLRLVNWADLADDDDNAEDSKEPWQKIERKKYKPAWMSQEHVDDEDNSEDGDEPWQFQKEKGSKKKGKDVDLTPLPPRARKTPARYK